MESTKISLRITIVYEVIEKRFLLHYISEMDIFLTIDDFQSLEREDSFTI